MDITEFISTFTQFPDNLSGIFVYTLSADISCSVVCTELVLYFKKKRYTQSTLVTLDGEIHALETAFAQATAPFLAPGVYSIKNTHTLTGKAKSYYRNFLGEYRGPHSFFIHEFTHEFTPEHTLEQETEIAKSAQDVVVTVPNKVTPELYELYAREFYGITDKLFIEQLFSKRTVLSCDQAFLLLSYQRVLGNKASSIVTQWLDKLCEPEYSLFTLSSHLFAGQRTLFFTLWANISREYSPEFWIIFWAEQLWQAIIFIDKQQTHGPAEAKRAVSRLPFSFMHKDWRRYNCVQLTQAHTVLCALDSSVKNGAELYIVETWFYTFFFKNSYK